MNKVFIIDDEEKLRRLLTRIISLEGFTLLEAGSLAAASKLLDKETVDVILCDVKLADGNGVDFLKEINNKPAILSKIPKGATIEFVEKDFPKKESKTSAKRKRKYVRVKNQFEVN